MSGNNYQVSRFIEVARTAQQIFDFISDLRNYSQWSPWMQHDPQVSITLEGKPATVGATYAWKGNKKIGEGCMIFEKIESPRSVFLKVEFYKPWKGTSLVEWRIEPNGAGCRVSWIMNGTYSGFLQKQLMKIFNLDKMIGRDFERGLSLLKEKVENMSA